MSDGGVCMGNGRITACSGWLAFNLTLLAIAGATSAILTLTPNSTPVTVIVTLTQVYNLTSVNNVAIELHHLSMARQ